MLMSLDAFGRIAFAPRSTWFRFSRTCFFSFNLINEKDESVCISNEQFIKRTAHWLFIKQTDAHDDHNCMQMKYFNIQSSGLIDKRWKPQQQIITIEAYIVQEIVFSLSEQ